jgi:hypothetical protein
MHKSSLPARRSAIRQADRLTYPDGSACSLGLIGVEPSKELASLHGRLGVLPKMPSRLDVVQLVQGFQ